MKAAIIQSSYVPWRGYFDIVDDVDLFVFYDDVQFTVRDWRSRNKIKTSQGPAWMTVPVKHVSRAQLICETELDSSQDWRRKHLELLDKWYSAAPHFRDYRDEFAGILGGPHETISQLNVALSRWIMEKLAIKTPVRLSMEFKAEGTKTDRLLDILKKAGARAYLSGPSARDYLDEEKFAKNGIALEYKTYEYIPYPQLWGDFLGEVSVLDLLFNAGPRSREFLKSRSPRPVPQTL